jgi:hypothetical protein
VVDTTVPIVHVSDLAVGATGPTGANVAYAPTATDLVDGEIPATCDPATGSLFGPETTTTVDCEATDVHGRTGYASFTVTVHGAVTIEDLVAEGTEVGVSLDTFAPGDYVVIDEGGPDQEVRYVSALGSIIFAAPVAHAHPLGTSVSVIAAPANDTIAPTIAFTQPGFVLKGSTLNVPVSCTDAGVGVEACRVPALPTLALGEHTVTVRSWDWNGNVSTAELRYTVVTAASGLANTGAQSVNPTVSLAILLLLTGLCLVAYRRWSSRAVW